MFDRLKTLCASAWRTILRICHHNGRLSFRTIEQQTSKRMGRSLSSGRMCITALIPLLSMALRHPQVCHLGEGLR